MWIARPERSRIGQTAADAQYVRTRKDGLHILNVPARRNAKSTFRVVRKTILLKALCMMSHVVPYRVEYIVEKAVGLLVGEQ